MRKKVIELKVASFYTTHTEFSLESSAKDHDVFFLSLLWIV